MDNLNGVDGQNYENVIEVIKINSSKLLMSIKSYLADSCEITHECTIKQTAHNDVMATKPKWFRNIIVSESNPETKHHFTSGYMIEQEIKRHANSPHWYIIHPLSKFAMYWEQFMFFVLVVNWIVVLFQISYHNDLTWVSELVNYAIQFPCVVDIVLGFFKGYATSFDVTLDHRSIIMRYLKTWFITDLITSIPFQIVVRLLAHRLDKVTLNIVILYQFLKVVTFTRIRLYFKHSWNAWNFQYLKYLISALVLVSLLGFTATSAIYQIGANFEQILYGNATNPLNKVNTLIPNPRIGKFWFKYLMCQYIVVNKYYCFTFPFTPMAGPTSLEICLDMTVIFISYAYQMYAFVKIIQLYQFMYDAEIKYQEIMSQLNRYMRTKELPLTLKNALVEFYRQRFQFRFFKEQKINENLSEALRRELVFHCGQIFIEKNVIFQDISISTINRIVSCFKSEMYMPNDLIIKAGTPGDCMYFIASGSVAMYTVNGQELLHLADGDHFGEISLFSKHGKRISNIVAIEYCQLFRLSKSDYEANIAIIPELAVKFETLAMQRMNATANFELLLKTEHGKKNKMANAE